MTDILIPKLFHWIWFGNKPLPEQHRKWMDGWLTLHPGWEHKIWTDHNRPTFTNEAQFLAAGNFAQKADIARYEIVYRYGGIYVDTDTECLRCIEPLLGGVEAFAVEGKSKVVEASPIGATPCHPWLEDVIVKLPHSMQTGWGNDHQTGPKFITKVTRAREDVRIFEERLFSSSAAPEGQRENTYTIHHASRSWDGSSHDRHETKLRELVSQDIEPVIPPGGLFLLVNKGQKLELSSGRRCLPFPERDGEWAGYPANDTAAIEELQRLRRAGAQFIVFPSPMFYWLDSYPGLKTFLHAQGRCVVNNDRCQIFEVA